MHRDNTGNVDLFWVECVDFLSLDYLGRRWSMHDLFSAADSIFFPLGVHWDWVLDTWKRRLS